MTTFTPKAHQRGVGLIEVMVTVLLLSTSLLALAALQNRSLQYNHEAYLRSQANILAYDIIDRIRTNPGQPTSYNIGFDDSAPTGNTPAARDVQEWRGNLANSLPDGKGEITCDGGTRICTVSLRWAEGEGSDARNEGDADTTTFTYQTRL